MMRKSLSARLLQKGIKYSMEYKGEQDMAFTDEILCTKSHEYIWEKSTIGLTDYAIDQLGDIVFLELPDVGVEFKKGEAFANIESVKAASEIYMPVSGKITDVNTSLVDAPELLNEDWQQGGWLVKIEPTDEGEFSQLITYEDYRKELE